MASNILTQDRLKELLHYCPDSGVFTWKKTKGAARSGSVVKCKDKRGYIVIRIDYVLYKAHRLVFLYMDGFLPVNDVDHLDGITSNNPYKNLRTVSHAENMKNMKKKSTNKSGITGVSWHKTSDKWMAFIAVNKKQFYLGLHISFFEACCVRKSAELKYNYHPNHGRRA